MEKPAFLDDIKVKISALKDKIFFWIKENKKLAIVIASLFCLMLICIIILICSFNKGKNQSEKIYKEQLQLTHELVIPNGPDLPDDYTISRETKENWSKEEGEQWFTLPSEKEINGLSKANDNLIDEILGAAP